MKNLLHQILDEEKQAGRDRSYYANLIDGYKDEKALSKDVCERGCLYRGLQLTIALMKNGNMRLIDELVRQGSTGKMYITRRADLSQKSAYVFLSKFTESFSAITDFLNDTLAKYHNGNGFYPEEQELLRPKILEARRALDVLEQMIDGIVPGEAVA